MIRSSSPRHEANYMGRTTWGESQCGRDGDVVGDVNEASEVSAWPTVATRSWQSELTALVAVSEGPVVDTVRLGPIDIGEAVTSFDPQLVRGEHLGGWSDPEATTVRCSNHP